MKTKDLGGGYSVSYRLDGVDGYIYARITHREGKRKTDRTQHVEFDVNLFGTSIPRNDFMCKFIEYLATN